MKDNTVERCEICGRADNVCDIVTHNLSDRIGVLERQGAKAIEVARCAEVYEWTEGDPENHGGCPLCYDGIRCNAGGPHPTGGALPAGCPLLSPGGVLVRAKV